MGHPDITNETAFVLEPLFLADIQNRPVFVPLVKATYTMADRGELVLSEKQQPTELAGQYYGNPEVSSLKYEPEGVYFKPATDVVLLGHAYAPHQAAATEVQVGFRVGALQKVAKVVGDRLLTRRAGMSFVSDPVPFIKMPLVYERAFGGWDRSDADSAKHNFEARNPVGMGYRCDARLNDDVALPNIEDPANPIRRLGDAPMPIGFGFISPNWQPRAALAGTYDKAWNATRKPRLPLNFDVRFFNSASSGLVAPGYLVGDEPVVVVNASTEGRAAFRLPGVPAPVCDVQLRGAITTPTPTRLDTVIVNMDERRVFLLWRAHVVLPRGPHQLVAATVHQHSQ
jgi:hypothetical protein